MQVTRDSYEINDDKSRLDLDVIHALLKDTYWAANRSRETIQTAIEHSICFGVFHGGKQIGFGRVITDFATYSYLCDVIIAPEHRGRGLGKWLVETMLAHPATQNGPVYLRTKDAHEMYRAFGFADSRCMRLGKGVDLSLPAGEGGC
jgi:GNAT superfamily N-acetyltransferase